MRAHLLGSVLVFSLGCGPSASPIPRPEVDAVEVPRPLVGTRTVPELIRDLTRDAPDGSGPHSPALDELIDIGEPALEPLLEVMLTDREGRRRCAEKGVYVIFARQCGLPKRGGWDEVELQENCRTAWGCLGNLDASASLDDRQRAVELWRQWLATKPFTR